MRRVPQKMWGTGYHRIFGIRYIYRICSPTVYYCWVCKITHTKMIALAIVLMHVRQLRTCPISLLTHSYTTHARTHGCSNAGEIDCTRVFAVHSQTCPNMYQDCITHKTESVWFSVLLQLKKAIHLYQKCDICIRHVHICVTDDTAQKMLHVCIDVCTRVNRLFTEVQVRLCMYVETFSYPHVKFPHP